VKSLRYLALATAVAAVGTYVWTLRVPPYEGRVGEVLNPDDPADQWRYAPVSHARVFVFWKRHRTTCVHSVYAETGTDGSFRTPGWWLTPSWPSRDRVSASFTLETTGFSRDLWLRDKDPAPSDYTLNVARDQKDLEPPFTEPLTLRERTGCPEP
jgi:hypothetical protein